MVIVHLRELYKDFSPYQNDKHIEFMYSRIRVLTILNAFLFHSILGGLTLVEMVFMNIELIL